MGVPLAPALAPQRAVASEAEAGQALSPVVLSWAALAVGVAGTALAVVPWLAGGSEQYTVPKLATLAVSALLSALAFARRRGGVQLRVVDVALVAHIVLGLFSGILNGPVWSVPASWFVPIATAALAASAVATLGTGRAEERVLQLVVLTTVLVGAVALLEACDVPLPWSGPRRPHSTLGNRNFVAADAAVGLVLALSMLARDVRRSSISLLVAIGGLAAVVTLTRCRSVWLAVAAAGLVALLLAGVARARFVRSQGPPRRALALGLVVAIAGSAAGALTPFPGLRWRDGGIVASATRVLEVDKGSGRGRLEDYALAAAMVRERPLLGWGPRRWDDASSAVAHSVESRHASAHVFWATPNSDAARIGGEQGLTGLLTLAAFLAALAQAWSLRWRRNDPVAVPALLGLSVYAANALSDAPLFRPSSLVVIAVLCALLRPGSPSLCRLPEISARRFTLAVALALVLLTAARVGAAALIRQGRGSVEARSDAQRLWPRPGVAQTIAMSQAMQGRCAEAEAAAQVALEWTPHHWAAPHFAGLCWLRAGDRARALGLRERALSIEPHLDVLIAHKRQSSGDLRGAEPRDVAADKPEPMAQQ